jgi:hypothetical protein
MNPLQLRQTIDHYLNQLPLIHLQTVAQMVTYLAGYKPSPISQPGLEWSEVIQRFEPQTCNQVQTEETTWEQLRQTMSLFAPSQLESSEAPSVYQGKPLSLEDLDRVIHIEAGKRQ